MPVEILENNVYYQAKGKLLDLAFEVAKTKNLGKVKDKIKQGAKIHRLLQGLDYGGYLTKAQRDRIVRTLVEVAEINDFSAAPVLGNIDPPSISFGGTTVINNTTSSDLTDFQNADVDTGTETADSFVLTARGAVWFYTVRKDSNQRSGTITGTWLADGSSVKFTEESTEDIGSTSDVTLSVDFSTPNIRLRATAASDNWIVEGSRLFING